MKLKNRILEWKNRYRRWRMSPAAYLVWTWLSDPTAWEVDTHFLIHKSTKFFLWTANEAYGIQLYENDDWANKKYDCFSNYDKAQIWKRAKPIFCPPTKVVTRKDVSYLLFERLMRAQLKEPE